MSYTQFLHNINTKAENFFRDIEVNYNFDYGVEFEIAICHMLRALLPNKYGVCRGFVVTSDGSEKGDDIVVYDQERFPTLRFVQESNYAVKQRIPIEAVYAYIEAKHTLCLEGDGGQSISKAVQQISAIKKLQREQIPPNRINPNMTIDIPFIRVQGWPESLNPMYCAIISRYVKIQESGNIVPTDNFISALHSKVASIAAPNVPPDLIIAGVNAVAIPNVSNEYKSPFYVEGMSELVSLKTEGSAFGVGLTSMLYAFDSITLGRIPWPSVLAGALNIPLVEDLSDPVVRRLKGNLS